ncbi:hypothetical protein FB451DRAFT_1406435 [Mycena latifolia]|nr:hypothetical protein FB451DRAFT_1406435 [Mycena latifolia]
MRLRRLTLTGPLPPYLGLNHLLAFGFIELRFQHVCLPREIIFRSRFPLTGSYDEHSESLYLLRCTDLHSSYHHVFLSITHLDICLDGSDRWGSWAHIASLPAFTHLALSEQVAYAILPQVIGECAHLRIMLVLTRSSWFQHIS